MHLQYYPIYILILEQSPKSLFIQWTITLSIVVNTGVLIQLLMSIGVEFIYQ